MFYWVDSGHTCEPCPRCGQPLVWRDRYDKTTKRYSTGLECARVGCHQPRRTAGLRLPQHSTQAWASTVDARTWD